MDSVKHPALLFVDSVSALASIDFRMDEWGVDVCVSGSQKGLMLPAGMGVTCVSQKALEPPRIATSRRCYFDYADMVTANASGYFPYTPSIPMLYGCANRWPSCRGRPGERVPSPQLPRRRRARGGIRGLEAAAVRLGAKVVLGHRLRHHGAGRHQWRDVIARAFKRYNLALGAGLSKVAGKLFRIGHLGDLNELMLLGAIAGAEMAMLDAGIKLEPGSGVAAAQSYWRHASQLSADKSSATAQAGIAHDGAGGVPGPRLAQGQGAQALLRTDYIEHDKTARRARSCRGCRARPSPSSTRCRCAPTACANCRS
jgi:alanine-glyoxylate transaminase/serine-glyoxylate transaminase/serine-pyruvate transaminase